MIAGVTHDMHGNIENKITRFRGKIGTGLAAKKGSNKTNAPQAAGYFMAMNETTKTQRVGSETVVINEWVINKEVQSKLEEAAGKSKTPRLLEIVSLFKTPDDMWDSFLALYSGDGLLCRGNGEGTEAKYLEFDGDGNREWKTKPCGFKECPDYISGKCKASGLMKIYPTIDPTPPNPYKFETRSVNTIRNIESSLDDIWSLIKTAHTVKELEAGHSLPFDGMFGMKMYLIHKKIKSGGRDVYVTELLASKEFREDIMKVISRAIDRSAESRSLEGEAGVTSLLDTAATAMISNEKIDTDTGEILSIEDKLSESDFAAMALLDEEE